VTATTELCIPTFHNDCFQVQQGDPLTCRSNSSVSTWDGLCTVLTLKWHM